MILSLASLSSDTDSRTVRTVNMATLTVWRLGTSQYYVRVKLFSQIKQEEYSQQGTQSAIIGES